MKEIRWHGRGGQGAKTVSQILAQINLREGKHVQSFPEYGPERSGAPVRAFNRIDDSEIKIHSGVYEPHVVVVVDESLLDTENTAEGLKPDGTLIVNTECSADDIRSRTGVSGTVVALDANKIADDAGTGFPNIPMLGAVAAALGSDLGVVEDEVQQTMGGKLSKDILEKNLVALRGGYEAGKGVHVGS